MINPSIRSQSIGASKPVNNNFVFAALLLLIVNYLAFNLFGISGAVLAVNRIAVILMLCVVLAKRPVVSGTTLFLMTACLGGVLLGGGGNNIALNIVFIVFFAISLRHVSLHLVVKYSWWVLLASLLISFAMLYAGITQNVVDAAGQRERATFGFSNVNAFTTLLYSFFTIAMFKSPARPLVKYLVCAGFSYLAYIYTDTRTLIASISVFILAHGLFAALHRRALLKYLSGSLLLLPVVFTQLSVYIAENYPLLDFLLSFRPSYNAFLIKSMSFYNHLFGGVSPAEGNTIDNSFLLVHASVGLPFLLFVTWLAYKKLVDSINAREPATYAFILSFWYFSYSESSLVRPESIIGLVFWLLISQRSTTHFINGKSSIS